MNPLDFARSHSGMAALSGREYDPAGLIDPDAYVASLRWRLVFAGVAVVFGVGVVVGVMLGEGSTREVSPNVCRAEEVSRIDCVHATTIAPTPPGVRR
ncbi:hypothetical protein ACFXPS_30990 [Nocardia sp. NPDC059091]|uniref:hypothetical protein n=1 Tax=Nocardia sp. NPDC059091 TaxID=3346724 RepID=UPI0036BECEC1